MRVIAEVVITVDGLRNNDCGSPVAAKQLHTIVFISTTVR